MNKIQFFYEKFANLMKAGGWWWWVGLCAGEVGGVGGVLVRGGVSGVVGDGVFGGW